MNMHVLSMTYASGLLAQNTVALPRMGQESHPPLNPGMWWLLGPRPRPLCRPGAGSCHLRTPEKLINI